MVADDVVTDVDGPVREASELGARGSALQAPTTRAAGTT
jgi:hypothetical protein